MPDETPVSSADAAPAKRTPCDQCLGCGKVDSRQKKSWRMHSRLPDKHPDTQAFYRGEIVPEVCPKCEGKGYTDGTEGKGLGLVPAKAEDVAARQSEEVERQARAEFEASAQFTAPTTDTKQ